MLKGRLTALASVAVFLVLTGGAAGLSLATSHHTSSANDRGKVTSDGRSETGPSTTVSSSHTSAKEIADCYCAALQQFSPESATTWWAIVEGNNTSNAIVARTSDSGDRWTDEFSSDVHVTGYFLDAEVAWLEQRKELYRTVDGGQSWQRLSEPGDCQLDFVNSLDGYCSVFVQRGDSVIAALYGTSDGGDTWTLVSHTVPTGHGNASVGVLPEPCSSQITFTSPDVGWLESGGCVSGSTYLCTTIDGGHTWRALSPVPPPPGGSEASGANFAAPVVSGPDIAVSVYVFAPQRQGGYTAIASSSDGGLAWQTHTFPGSVQYWSADVIDPSDWLLTFGNALESTTNSGLRWRSTTLPRTLMPLNPGIDAATLTFLSPLLGWATEGGGTDGPVWGTQDGGASWRQVVVQAGPYRV